MEKYRSTAERNPKLYGEFIHSVFARALMEQQILMENAGVGAEELDPELGILYRDISEFRDTEIPKAIAMIQEVARQINGELSASSTFSELGLEKGRVQYIRVQSGGDWLTAPPLLCYS